MRKLIITLVLTAFIITLSSPILYAAQWDSANGPNWVDQAYVDRADVSGDDHPWQDEELPPKYSYNFISLFIWFIDFQIFDINNENEYIIIDDLDNEATNSIDNSRNQ